MHLALICAAFAAEPTMSTDTDGRTIVGVIEFEGDMAAAVALQHDPIKAAKVAGTDMTVTPGASDGPCQLFDYHVNNWFMDVDYQARFCKTPTGYVSTLADEKGDLSEYRTEMHIEDLGGGRLRMTYRSLVSPSLPVPGGVMRAQVSDEVSLFLSNTGRWLERLSRG
ncbi:MAG: hypothetical protein H6741_33400 [Alphaproteobacteria bacterium]|nr:hypothetical protein [Alphaproteobacteria bacterium]MCB9797612.1 hypothetical protein [Alphaproteobacteria bacterium]